ncbi:MAG: S9 family peptidase [Armatimonadetes bacterium]|nr:S9 family peptidase [Armatimonadota bacterium]
MQRQVAPYGSWKSPITTDLIVSETIGLGQIALDGNDTYWIEMRPAEGGRHVIVRRSGDGDTTEVNPSPYNARTRVHEYGGGAFAVDSGVVYFSNFADQRLYRQAPGELPQPLTPESERRYADGMIDRSRRRLACVCEDHTPRAKEPVNSLVSISLQEPQDFQVLAWGNDFYSSPRLSSDGNRLAWLTWNHPNMPWDGTELWVGELDAKGALGRTQQVAGGPDESIAQPEWGPDGALYFVSDRTNWWNLFRWKNGGAEPLYEMEAEFSRPAWVFGVSQYAVIDADRIVCSFYEKGGWRLALLEVSTGRLTPLETAYTEIRFLQSKGHRIVFQGGSPKEMTAIVQMDLAGSGVEVLRKASNLTLEEGGLSTPQPIEFPTAGGVTAHAFYYAPKSQEFTGPEEERPPLLVKSHGGPTSAASTALALEVQYWTSRGFAILDVNYGGSTGYGREYRERLREQWGVVDVEDCVRGARFLLDRGEVDGEKLAISGGSAGGYTTLSVLTFRDLFKVGASYFGISDLEAMATDTHKFESRYLDSLVGPYPEQRQVYFDRSPLHHTDQLCCPVIFFQGLEDKVVPPNQAEMMVEALRTKGLPVAYLPFEGEQHGFRRAETIKQALEAELCFYSRILGFDLADPVEPVKIENLQASV